MASQDDITDFNRRSRSVGAAVPIQEIPKLSEIVGSPEPTRLARMREFDRRMDEWRKSLITTGVLGASEKKAITTASAAAASSTPGPAGRDGLDGLNGLNGRNGIDGINGKDGADGAGSVPPDQLGLVQHVWIAFRTDGVPGTGSITDPFDGSTADKFDTVMMGLVAYTDIHIGPGVFETRGNRNNVLAGGWYAKEGQKISGSGIDKTVLKLIDCPDPAWLYWIIGNRRSPNLGGSFIEVSDLTCDCNTRGNPTAASYGAIIMSGAALVVRRVRCVDWGARPGGEECFVIFLDGYFTEERSFQPVTIENCICDAPFEGPLGNNHSILFAGSSIQNPMEGTSFFDYNAVIRGNVIDGTFISGALQPHPLMTGMCADGRGVPIIEDNLVINATTGLYRDSWLSRNMVVRNNRFFNCQNGIFLVAGNVLSAAFGTDSNIRAYYDITLISSAGTTVTAMTNAAHGLLPGDWVELRGTGQAAFDGVWKLVTASGSQFTYVIASFTGAASSGQVVKADARAMVALARNPLDHTQGAVDVGVRHGLRIGSFVQVGGVSGADAAKYNRSFGKVLAVTSTTFTYALNGTAGADAPAGEKVWWEQTGFQPDPAHLISSDGSNVATVTTKWQHDYEVGDWISITGVDGGASDSFYNGIFQIGAVTAFTFTYQMLGAGHGESTGRARFTNFWTIRHLWIGENYIEVPGPPWNNGVPNNGAGIVLSAAGYESVQELSLALFENVLMRGNVIRMAGNDIGTSQNLGISMSHVKNLVCEGNVINTIWPGTPQQRLRIWQPVGAWNLRFSNNRDYAGNLIRCYEENSGRYYKEPEREFESVQLLQAGGVWG